MFFHLFVHSGERDECVVTVQEDGVLDVLPVVGMLGIRVAEVLHLKDICVNPIKLEIL